MFILGSKNGTIQIHWSCEDQDAEAFSKQLEAKGYSVEVLTNEEYYSNIEE